MVFTRWAHMSFFLEPSTSAVVFDGRMDIDSFIMTSIENGS